MLRMENLMDLAKRFKRLDTHPCVCPTVLFFIEGVTAETEEDAKRLANLGCDVQHQWEPIGGEEKDG